MDGKVVGGIIVTILVVGGLVLFAIPLSNQLSCSAPPVIETLRAIGLTKEATDYEITNTGPLGTNGNVLLCSGEWEAISTEPLNVFVGAIGMPAGERQRRNYTVQPLDNGQFRITIPSAGLMTAFGPRVPEGVGPMSYVNAKRKYDQRVEEQRRKQEDRERKASVISDPKRRAYCISSLEIPIDQCVQETLLREEYQLQQQKRKEEQEARMARIRQALSNPSSCTLEARKGDKEVDECIRNMQRLEKQQEEFKQESERKDQARKLRAEKIDKALIDQNHKTICMITPRPVDQCIQELQQLEEMVIQAIPDPAYRSGCLQSTTVQSAQGCIRNYQQRVRR